MAAASASVPRAAGKAASSAAGAAPAGAARSASPAPAARHACSGGCCSEPALCSGVMASVETDQVEASTPGARERRWPDPCRQAGGGACSWPCHCSSCLSPSPGSESPPPPPLPPSAAPRTGTATAAGRPSQPAASRCASSCSWARLHRASNTPTFSSRYGIKSSSCASHTVQGPAVLHGSSGGKAGKGGRGTVAPGLDRWAPKQPGSCPGAANPPAPLLQLLNSYSDNSKPLLFWA